MAATPAKTIDTTADMAHARSYIVADAYIFAIGEISWSNADCYLELISVMTLFEVVYIIF